jgi:hypothetical protein
MVTGVLGWLVLLFGLSVALLLFLVLHAVWTLAVAVAVALPLVVVTLGLGLPLVVGGKALRRSGNATERGIREQALLSMLSVRGRVSAAGAASALGLPLEVVDALLTDLAKRQPERVGVDVDDEGTVWYRPAATDVGAWEAVARLRVDPPAPAAPPDRAEEDDEAPGSESARGSGGKVAH